MRDRIAFLRKKLKLTQGEFGERLGLGKSAISRIENGIIEPTSQTLKFICREFNVNYVWLTEGTGDIFRDDDNAICEFIDIVMADATESQRNAFRSIASLDATYWEAINKFMQSILNEKNRGRE